MVGPQSRSKIWGLNFSQWSRHGFWQWVEIYLKSTARDAKLFNLILLLQTIKKEVIKEKKKKINKH